MEIRKKIVGYDVVKVDGDVDEEISDTGSIVQMTEDIDRPEVISGTTYKIKPPEHVSEHAFYVTINNVILNPGTADEKTVPFEIFINTKSLEYYQWIVALTLVMSAVFRKGGEFTFLVDELESVFDPRGGYWNRGKYVSSIIAEIGAVVKKHLTSIGMLEVEELDESQLQLIAEKRAEFEALDRSDDDNESNGYPPGASLCSKCREKAVVVKDGCNCCLSCGDSKCS